MSSSNKTPLGFNIWSGTDTPKREDFNADNQLADNLISNIEPPENVAIKDGTLQTNLNAEMLDGKKVSEVLSRLNILHNWYFKNPVNQRGVTETISTAGYFIDRWRLISGTVTLTANGLTLNGTIIQPLEYAAGTNVFASIKVYSGTATASYDNATKTFTITSGGGTIESAKLEAGTSSTLAADPPQDYGVELAKCQRYQLSTGYNRLRAVFISANEIHASVPLPTMFRMNPAFTGSFGVQTLSGANVTGFTMAVSNLGSNMIRLIFTKDTHGLTDASIYINGIFDANL